LLDCNASRISEMGGESNPNELWPKSVNFPDFSL
jgi:hypothetical protein